MGTQTYTYVIRKAYTMHGSNTSHAVRRSAWIKKIKTFGIFYIQAIIQYLTNTLLIIITCNWCCFFYVVYGTLQLFINISLYHIGTGIFIIYSN